MAAVTAPKTPSTAQLDEPTAASELNAWVVKWRAKGPHVLLGSLMATAVKIARSLPLSREGFFEGAIQTWHAYDEVFDRAARRKKN